MISFEDLNLVFRIWVLNATTEATLKIIQCKQDFATTFRSLTRKIYGLRYWGIFWAQYTMPTPGPTPRCKVSRCTHWNNSKLKWICLGLHLCFFKMMCDTICMFSKLIFDFGFVFLKVGISSYISLKVVISYFVELCFNLYIENYECWVMLYLVCKVLWMLWISTSNFFKSMFCVYDALKV